MKIKEPREVLKNIKKFVGENGNLAFLVVMIVGLITHCYLYTNNVIAPDALGIGTYYISGDWEQSLGRWGIQLFDFFRGGIVNEILIVVISLFFLALSAIMIIKLFNVKSKISVALISVLLATAPQFASTFLFTYCADAYCFAILASTFSVYFLRKETKKVVNYILTVIFIIFTLSIYQAYICVIASLYIALLILDLLENKDGKEVLKSAIYQAIAIVLGMILYFVITKVILKLQGLDFASYGGANEVSITNFRISSIVETYKTFFHYFFGNSVLYNSYWKRDIINLLIFATGIISLVNVIIKNKISKNKLNIFLLIVLGILFPIAISSIEIITPERKVNLVTGGAALLIVYVLFIKAYELLKENNLDNILKYLIICLILIISLTFVFSNNATYMIREEIFRNYYATVIDLWNRATNLEGYSSDMKWMFNDIIRYKSKLSNMANGLISNDNETWNNFDGISLNIQFNDRYLGRKIQMCSKEEYDEIINSEEYIDMPIYPDNGSVKIINNIVVVKLNNNVF